MASSLPEDKDYEVFAFLNLLSSSFFTFNGITGDFKVKKDECHTFLHAFIVRLFVLVLLFLDERAFGAGMCFIVHSVQICPQQ